MKAIPAVPGTRFASAIPRFGHAPADANQEYLLFANTRACDAESRIGYSSRA
jgi:hypothetical protein